MSDNLELIDTLLTSQVRAIRWQLALAALMIVIGLVLFTVGTLADRLIPGIPKSAWISAVGACASTLSAFPIKDLLLRQEKADALKLLKSRINTLESQPKADRAEVERITTMLWSSMKTIIER